MEKVKQIHQMVIVTTTSPNNYTAQDDSVTTETVYHIQQEEIPATYGTDGSELTPKVEAKQISLKMSDMSQALQDSLMATFQLAIAEYVAQ